MKLSEQHPRVIVARVLLLEQLKKIDKKEIEEIAPNFIIKYNEEIDNKVQEVVEIDWEYALFTATAHELQKLFDTFVSNKKENKEELNEVE